MKKNLLLFIIVIMLGIGVWAARSSDPQQHGLSAPLPPDSEFPASGVCAAPNENGEAAVAINRDIPSPRCQRVTADDRLVVHNNTKETLSLWFGESREYAFTLLADETFTVPENIGALLAPGVHVLHGEPYQGPELWVITGETPLLYRFEDFSAEEVFAGAPAEVDFSTYPSAKEFRTKITEGAARGPNFAGHYTVVDWGCGTSCQTFAVLDAKTGAITDYGFGSALGLDFKKESRLLIANPPRTLNVLEVLPGGTAAEYYELKDGKLSLLARQRPGEKEAIVCAQVITRARNIITGEERDFPTPCAVPYLWQSLGH